MGIGFIRRISIIGDKLLIEDTIDYSKNISKLIVGSRLPFIYGESSRYFQNVELSFAPVVYEKSNLPSRNDVSKISIIREYDKLGKLKTLDIKQL